MAYANLLTILKYLQLHWWRARARPETFGNKLQLQQGIFVRAHGLLLLFKIQHSFTYFKKLAREQALHLEITRSEGRITLTCELSDLKSEDGLSSLEFNYNYYSIFIAGVRERSHLRLVFWKLCIIQTLCFCLCEAPVERGNFRPHSKHLPNSFLKKRKISFGLLKLLWMVFNYFIHFFTVRCETRHIRAWAFRI